MNTLDIDGILQIVITSILLPMAVWGFQKLREYGDAKIALVKNQKIQNILANAAEELERAVTLSVADVGATYVEALKKEGKLTQEQMIEANKKALDKTVAIMSNAGMEALKNAEIDITAYVKALIEETLKFDKGE